MNITAKYLKLSLLLLAFSNAASAADSDVSTLNGELVQVGDHNKFRYSHPKWNIATNPFSMINGTYGASVSYGITSNVAIRGDVNYSDGFDNSSEGFETGISAPIYFRKTYDGWFLEPGLMVQSEKRVIYDDNGDATKSKNAIMSMGPQVTLGHHWIWDSGLNFAWGIGAGRNWVKKKSETSDQYDRTFGTGYLRFGYAF